MKADLGRRGFWNMTMTARGHLALSETCQVDTTKSLDALMERFFSYLEYERTSTEFFIEQS